METIFPTDTGFEGFFVVGFRKYPDGSGQTQRTGTVILKRTYDIVDPVSGTLVPCAEPLPVFTQDVPDNLVVNGDFQSSQKTFGESEDENAPGAWQAMAGAIAGLAAGEGVSGDSEDNALQVTGTANSRVVQTISFEEPLGGRSFTFSFQAKADVNPTTIQDVQLEADGSSPVCVIDETLGMNGRFRASGTWPASVQATEMRVVLRMATDATRTVFYDDVQVEERNYLTSGPITALRYEHDLAPCKPEGDVIVLGSTDIEGTNLVKVNSDIWLQRDVSLNGNGRDKALFGWEPRVDSDRKESAGSFSEDPDDYPPEWPVTQPGRDPLPSDFQNVFYNGYLRSAAQAAAIPFLHLPADAQISIERGDTDVDLYGFTLANEVVTARYFYYSGTGLDRENRWQGRDVPVNLDTLVIEPEEDRCYAVWRGVWDFDEHSEDAYRRLVVEA